MHRALPGRHGRSRVHALVWKYHSSKPAAHVPVHPGTSVTSIARGRHQWVSHGAIGWSENLLASLNIDAFDSVLTVPYLVPEIEGPKLQRARLLRGEVRLLQLRPAVIQVIVIGKDVLIQLAHCDLVDIRELIVVADSPGGARNWYH